MRPIERTPRRRFQQSNTVVATVAESNSRVPSEFLRELQSAASMIMSREECVALEQEIQMLRRPRAVAAA